MTTLREQLCRYIEDQVLHGAPEGTIGPDDSLVERGVVDSVAVLGLITFIEEQTGLRIPDRDVRLEHFETVTAMEALVARLRASSPS